MRELSIAENILIAGGEIIPGTPSDLLNCINIKLMIYAGRGEPGYDVGVAALAYNKYCPCEDYPTALEYARQGDNGFVFFLDVVISFLLLPFYS